MLSRSFLKHGILFAFLPILALLLSQPSTAADKSLVLLPLVIYSDQPKDYLRPGLQSMFVSRLSGEGLQLISDEKLYPLLKEKEKEGINSKERAEEIARALKADFAVFGSLTSIGPGFSLDLSVLELGKEESKVTRISEAVPENQLIPKLADMVYNIRAVIAGVDIRPQRREEAEADLKNKSIIGLFYPPGAEDKTLKPAGRLSFGMDVMGCDTGDLDGDGQPELVVLGRKKLLVYAKKDKLILKDTLESSMGEEFIKVSVGDLNGDGKAEIYLVSSDSKANTSILEWTGKFRKILKTNRHLQVVKAADSMPLLLSQDSFASQDTFTPDASARRYFYGKISVMAFDGASLTPKEALPEFAEGAQFYTLTPIDPGRRGVSGYVGLNLDSYLCLWDGGGNLVWRAEEKVGGTNNFTTPTGMLAQQDMLNPTFFNARILVTDLNQDRKKEILVIENILMYKYTRLMKIVEKSNLVAYAVEPGRLAPIWKTPTFSYCITDMQTNGKTLFLAAQRGKMSTLGEGSGLIFWFE
jgi:hypothetical protein